MSDDAEARIPYGRQWVDEEDVRAVTRVLRGDWLTTGPAVAEFEASLAAATGARHAVVVSSGTAALHAAYASAGLAAGDEIVTTPLTFVATASAALHLGAEVRFADVDSDTGLLDPDAVSHACSERTRLLVPVDYAGHPADYARLRAVAARHEALVVADAAHSLGATREGRAVGTLADQTTTSFHPVKLITSGEGGAILTDREDLAERARRFRHHGIDADPDAPWRPSVHELGLNYRLPDVLCALGLSQLRKLKGFLDRRRRIAAVYARELAELPGLVLPHVAQGVEHAWHLYVVRVREAQRRPAFFEALRDRGLAVQLHYLPVHLQPVFRERGFLPGQFPVAEDWGARAVSLPLFPALSDSEVEQVVERVRAAARETL